MKLDLFIKNEKRFAMEAKSLINKYLERNPRINDIRMLMTDESACEKFKRWTTVKPGKDLATSEKKSLPFG